MTIRNIKQFDNEALASLIKSIFEEYHAPLINTVYDDPRTLTMYETFLTPRSEYFVVEDNGEVLGGCGYYPTDGLPTGYAELVKFYFSPKLRGRGMGKRLMLQVIEAAKTAGYDFLYIESFPEFSFAVSMYEKNGFVHLPSRLGNSGHTATTIHMVKDLRDSIKRTKIVDQLSLAMISYNNADPMRIQHTTKVHSYARLIGLGEGLNEEAQFILESAALVHDIGIRASEKKYGYQNGKLQEQEGPSVAKELLTRLGGYNEAQIERICWLVGHHHTYHIPKDEIGDIVEPYQILIEADFLVNLYEDNESPKAIEAVRQNIFKTKSGLKMFDDMFHVKE